MPGDAQGPRLMTSKAGNLEQLHDSDWRDFLPNPTAEKWSQDLMKVTLGAGEESE